MPRNTKINLTYDAFPRVMMEKINFMKRDMEEFKNFGYSEENAQQLEEKPKTFSDIPTDEETEGDRMIITEKKNRICETGKEIWNDLNEAKYNDYIIYNTPSGKPEKQYIEEAAE